MQAVMIWAPFTSNNGQWIASKTLQGFFGAPVEALCEISMTDIVSLAISTLLRISVTSNRIVVHT